MKTITPKIKMVSIPETEFNELSDAYNDYTLDKIAQLGYLLELVVPDVSETGKFSDEQRIRPCFGKDEAHKIKQKILALVDTL